MSDYTWLAQPIATVVAGVLAVGAATVAYRAASAGVREQRRIATRREIATAFDALVRELLAFQMNSIQYSTRRPDADTSSAAKYGEALEREPMLVRSVMFAAVSVKLLGYQEIFDLVSSAMQHYGAHGTLVRSAADRGSSVDDQVLMDEATAAMVAGQQDVIAATDAIEREIALVGPHAD